MSKNGLSTNRPQSPYTTLGMAARMSTNVARGFAIAPRTWFNSNASPTATGTDRTTAVAEVSKVPKMNGSAPNASRPDTGFQSVPVKKPKPKRENVRHDPLIRSVMR